MLTETRQKTTKVVKSWYYTVYTPPRHARKC